jgi:outer membrane lipoprotein-sorting protein
MKPEDEIHELMEKLRVSPNAEMDKRVHGDISKTLAELRRSIPAERPPVIWRVIIKSPITKLAAAIIIALLIGLTIIPDVGGGVALAEVLDKLNEIRSFAYRVEITAGQHGGHIGKQDDLIWQMQVLESRDYGRRIYWYWVKGPASIPVETTEPITKVYILQSEGTMVSVRPDEKKVWRRKLSGGPWHWQEHQDSKIFLKGFTQHPYTRLGRDTINGIQAELFESTDPHVAGGPFGNPVARLWIDTKTKLPVRMEIESFANSTDGSPTDRRVFYGFEWNVQIDAADFDPNIPDDYELVPEVEEVEQSIDQTTITEALHFFAELTRGKYPSTLSGKRVYQELSAAWMAKHGVPLEQQSRQQDIRNTLKLDATIGYYASLARQDKDPAYHGDKVTAKDSDRVLMRWKISDDQYRVIFGDLTINKIPAERLTDLEKLSTE